MRVRSMLRHGEQETYQASQGHTVREDNRLSPSPPRSNMSPALAAARRWRFRSVRKQSRAVVSTAEQVRVRSTDVRAWTYPSTTGYFDGTSRFSSSNQLRTT